MNEVSCPECGSYAVEQTTEADESNYCEYHCDDCGHYFVDKSKDEGSEDE